MAPDKSLAAEIEAVKLALHQRLPIDDDLADDAAKHIVRTVIAPRLAEIAALQSRAFEDGARWMRERAASEAETVWEWIPSECADEPYEAIALEIRHLPLPPEGERNA